MRQGWQRLRPAVNCHLHGPRRAGHHRTPDARPLACRSPSSRTAPMADHHRASVTLDVQPHSAPRAAVPQPEDPFRIALIGDFRGSAARSQTLRDRRPVAVDRDDLDEVLARFAPRLAIELEDDTAVELGFAELEDFHADRLFTRAPFFRSLREARQRLADPASFGSALESILGAAPPRPAIGGADADDVVADVLSGSVLDRVLDNGGRDAPRTSDPLQSYLRRIVAPHVVPGEDPEREKLLADVDASVAAGLRAVLHHPAFQALESLWLGVDLLVRRLETGTSLRLYLIDATKAELAADGGVTQLAAVLDTVGDAGWSVLLADASIAADAADLSLLRDLAALAARLGAPVIAGAHASLVGIDSFRTMPDASDVEPWNDDAWHAFRRSSDAASAGLVLPRMMLRVPYGEEGEPSERLRDFEELDTPPSHEHFLWGNGAFAAALLLGQAFTDSGWRMRPGAHHDVTNLPVHNWSGPHGPDLVPCAECTMSDRLAEALLDAGPMVLATVKHGETARLVRFQSLAAPPRALQGPWSRMG